MSGLSLGFIIRVYSLLYIFPNLTLPNWQMELCSSTPNLAGASKANGAMFRLLRTQFRVYYLGLKMITVVINGAKGLTSPSGLAIKPTNNPFIHFKTKK